MQDFIAALIYALVCVGSSYVAVEIRKEHLPAWATAITSVLGMIIWSYVVKHSVLSLVKLSALYDVVGALAYFVGFVIYGEHINSTQWCGILLMVFSIFLINNH